MKKVCADCVSGVNNYIPSIILMVVKFLFELKKAGYQFEQEQIKIKYWLMMNEYSNALEALTMENLKNERKHN